MLIKEIRSSSILNKSGITDYCINPYMGCSFGCRYCYAQLIVRRFTKENWGEFVFPKVNAPDVLERQLKTAKKGNIFISSITDAYQPLEQKYELTKKCLFALIEYQYPISVLTKSPLVLRDIELLKKFNDCEVGMTITTNDEKIRKVFEPKSPPTLARIDTLKKLHTAGLQTYAFLGPILPMNTEELADTLTGIVDYVYIDKLNYNFQVKRICEENNLQFLLEENFFIDMKNKLVKELRKNSIRCKVLF